MFGNFGNNGMLFMLILLLLFSFSGNGINSTESLLLIFSAFALLLAGGMGNFGNICDGRRDGIQ